MLWTSPSRSTKRTVSNWRSASADASLAACRVAEEGERLGLGCDRYRHARARRAPRPVRSSKASIRARPTRAPRSVGADGQGGLVTRSRAGPDRRRAVRTRRPRTRRSPRSTVLAGAGSRAAAASRGDRRTSDSASCGIARSRRRVGPGGCRAPGRWRPPRAARRSRRASVETSELELCVGHRRQGAELRSDRRAYSDSAVASAPAKSWSVNRIAASIARPPARRAPQPRRRSPHRAPAGDRRGRRSTDRGRGKARPASSRTGSRAAQRRQVRRPDGDRPIELRDRTGNEDAGRRAGTSIGAALSAPIGVEVPGSAGRAAGATGAPMWPTT